MRTYLDFEKPIAELESRIEDLRKMDGQTGVNVAEEIEKLQTKADHLLADAYSKLSRWQKAQVARHSSRPHFSNYVDLLVDDFTPIAGDRAFGEDAAILGGPARLRGRSVMLIGHEKGADTASRVEHNFGMARPEGYRKAMRLMDMAERFNLPVVTLVDTPGAYPGRGAEERGQAEAIASCTEKCLGLGAPIISVKAAIRSPGRFFQVMDDSCHRTIAAAPRTVPSRRPDTKRANPDPVRRCRTGGLTGRVAASCIFRGSGQMPSFLAAASSLE